MEKTKTAEEILATYHPISRDFDLKVDLWPDGTVLMFAKEYARQALEAYRDGILKELPPVTSKDAYKIRFKIRQHILNFNIDDFIK